MIAKIRSYNSFYNSIVFAILIMVGNLKFWFSIRTIPHYKLFLCIR